jgi:hypothetical protein
MCAELGASPDWWGGRDFSLPCWRNHNDCTNLCKSIHKLDELPEPDSNPYAYDAAGLAKSPIPTIWACHREPPEQAS